MSKLPSLGGLIWDATKQAVKREVVQTIARNFGSAGRVAASAIRMRDEVRVEAGLGSPSQQFLRGNNLGGGTKSSARGGIGGRLSQQSDAFARNYSRASARLNDRRFVHLGRQIGDAIDALNTQVRPVSQANEGLDVEQNFQIIAKQFNLVARGFTSMDQRFAALESNLDKTFAAQAQVLTHNQRKVAQLVDQKIDAIDNKMDKLTGQVRTHDRQLDKLVAEFNRLKRDTTGPKFNKPKAPGLQNRNPYEKKESGNAFGDLLGSLPGWLKKAGAGAGAAAMALSKRAGPLAALAALGYIGYDTYDYFKNPQKNSDWWKDSINKKLRAANGATDNKPNKGPLENKVKTTTPVEVSAQDIKVESKRNIEYVAERDLKFEGKGTIRLKASKIILDAPVIDIQGSVGRDGFKLGGSGPADGSRAGSHAPAGKYDVGKLQMPQQNPEARDSKKWSVSKPNPRAERRRALAKRMVSRSARLQTGQDVVSQPQTHGSVGPGPQTTRRNQNMGGSQPGPGYHSSDIKTGRDKAYVGRTNSNVRGQSITPPSYSIPGHDFSQSYSKRRLVSEDQLQRMARDSTNLLRGYGATGISGGSAGAGGFLSGFGGFPYGGAGGGYSGSQPGPGYSGSGYRAPGGRAYGGARPNLSPQQIHSQEAAQHVRDTIGKYAYNKNRSTGEQTSLTADARGGVDQTQTRNFLASQIAKSKLNGYVPKDGALYGIKTGSPLEWANLMTKQIPGEAGFVKGGKGIDRKFNTFGSGDAGQFEGGSHGLFQLSVNDPVNYGTGPKATRQQLNDPQWNASEAVKYTESLVMKSGTIRGGMGKYWGPIRRGWTPQEGNPWGDLPQDNLAKNAPGLARLKSVMANKQSTPGSFPKPGTVNGQSIKFAPGSTVNGRPVDVNDAFGPMNAVPQYTAARRKGEYGEFNWALSQEGQQALGWGQGRNLKTITLSNGAKYTVNSVAGDRFKGFGDEMIARGYNVSTAGGGGAYNWRGKRGSSGLSVHATGTAIDINVPKNPWKGPTDMPENVENLAWKHGLSWGARFHDPMHFEVMGPGAWTNKLVENYKRGFQSEGDIRAIAQANGLELPKQLPPLNEGVKSPKDQINTPGKVRKDAVNAWKGRQARRNANQPRLEAQRGDGSKIPPKPMADRALTADMPAPMKPPMKLGGPPQTPDMKPAERAMMEKNRAVLDKGPGKFASTGLAMSRAKQNVDNMVAGRVNAFGQVSPQQRRAMAKRVQAKSKAGVSAPGKPSPAASASGVKAVPQKPTAKATGGKASNAAVKKGGNAAKPKEKEPTSKAAPVASGGRSRAEGKSSKGASDKSAPKSTPKSASKGGGSKGPSGPSGSGTAKGGGSDMSGASDLQPPTNNSSDSSPPTPGSDGSGDYRHCLI